ncbi:hypothetical protein ACFO1B_56210 [Dactylosporangium siamense]|uniref:Uncharacterized protein n=1 Tax=Dactylosporangium siamense TaxID=685454 RepID=A0A919UF15_9ACTN|nr:hypothetical protein [Dactylosporangium siamense]GIG53187.1 hypothetical protein Dsi01nite_112280 [Dactylosporangium siamense]
MTNMGGRGPSYDFWLRVQRELDAQAMTVRELVERSGVQHTVIGSLQYASIRNRSARRLNVLKVAEALSIPQDEALQLAGLTTPALDHSVDVRAAIRSSSAYDDDQKTALYQLLDLFDRDRDLRRGQSESKAS